MPQQHLASHQKELVVGGCEFPFSPESSPFAVTAPGMVGSRIKSGAESVALQQLHQHFGTNYWVGLGACGGLVWGPPYGNPEHPRYPGIESMPHPHRNPKIQNPKSSSQQHKKDPIDT